MIASTGCIMSADRQVVRIENGIVVDIDKQFAPLHFVNGRAKELFKTLDIPAITKEMIMDCVNKIRVNINEKFIVDFILNG